MTASPGWHQDERGGECVDWSGDNLACVDRHFECCFAIQTVEPAIVPMEATQIVRAGSREIVGRITSSRMSPTLNRVRSVQLQSRPVMGTV